MNFFFSSVEARRRSSKRALFRDRKSHVMREVSRLFLLVQEYLVYLCRGRLFFRRNRRPNGPPSNLKNSLPRHGVSTTVRILNLTQRGPCGVHLWSTASLPNTTTALTRHDRKCKGFSNLLANPLLESVLRLYVRKYAIHIFVVSG